MITLPVGLSEGCARLIMGRLTAINSSQALCGCLGFSGSSSNGRMTGDCFFGFNLAPSNSDDEWNAAEGEEENGVAVEEEEEKVEDSRRTENWQARVFMPLS